MLVSVCIVLLFFNRQLGGYVLLSPSLYFSQPSFVLGTSQTWQVIIVLRSASVILQSLIQENSFYIFPVNSTQLHHLYSWQFYFRIGRSRKNTVSTCFSLVQYLVLFQRLFLCIQFIQVFLPGLLALCCFSSFNSQCFGQLLFLHLVLKI